MTRYIVLQERVTPAAEGSQKSWASISTVEARSPRHAIEKAITPKEDDKGDPLSGKFVAVPARNWKPETVAVEVQAKLSFS